MPEGSLISVGEIRLHTVLAGPEEGELVVLLHGFPELWRSFRRQLQPLADAGYRVALPDQRGYNHSDRPRRAADYAIDRLGMDVVGLIHALGRERAHIVGHDWGGCVAWWVAARHPDVTASLTALNMPHVFAMERALKTRPSQLWRSWYILLFQLPVLPELLLGLNGYAGLAGALTERSRPGAFTEDDLAACRAAWSTPGALTAMLNWYRAALQHQPPAPRPDPRILAPTAIIWGDRDDLFEPDLVEQSAALCRDVTVHHLPDAHHFVHADAPEVVTDLILQHLRTHPIEVA